MRDVNDMMPKLPGMRWGALFNWNLSRAEINEMVRRPPFPEDAKWHLVQRDNDVKDSKEIIVDGHVVRRADDSKLT